MKKQELIDLVEVVIQHEAEAFTADYPWAKPVVPAKEDKYQGGTLKHWKGIFNEHGELMHIYGYVYGDDRWRDGTDVRTSYIVDLQYDEESQTGVVETRNTIYQLSERLKL